MIGIHTAEAIRAAEEEFIAANPDTDLMQLAAAAVAERAAQLAPSGTVLVVVGPGNNGGDGLYAARNLARQGRHVTVWLVNGKAHPGGVVAARQASIRFVDSLTVLRMLPEMSLVIDAVAGIGGRPGLSHVVAQFFDACQTLAIPVLAVDVPSGLDPDSHQRPETFVQAAHTITFGAPKLCTVAQPAASACGDLEIVDLGFELPDSQINKMQRVDVARWWPWPSPYSDKYSRGVLGIDTGSDRYPGAAVLSVIGALYSGAGMVRFVGPERAAGAVLNAQPSVTMGQGRVQAWLAGCGWGPEASAERLAPLVEEGLPTIVDAEALAYLPDELPAGWLLTPHAGELAEMLGTERAAVLSVIGALYSGAGMVRFVGPDRAAGAVLNAQPSVTMGQGRVQAWLAGCGWGPEASADRLAPLVEEGLPTIVDAEALAYLPDELPAGWLLTPHAGELAEMLGTERAAVVADPIKHVRRAAARWNTTVLLKGSTQYVAEPSGRISLAVAGPAWTAQAGSGDVLAGICGTLLAAGVPAWKAAVIGASVQALAAARKSGPFPPEVVAQALPEVLDQLGQVVSGQAIRAGSLTPSSIAFS